MGWAFIAIISAALSAVVSIFDSHLLTHRLPDLRTYLLPLGIFHFLVAVVLLAFHPFPPGAQTLPLIAAFGSGILSGASTIITLNTIRSVEISRVIPVINSSPIFVALIAAPLLGEVLGLQAWGGILLTVAGAVLISLQRGAGKKKVSLQRSFFALTLASLLYALSSVITKYALQTLTYWNLYSSNAIAMGLIFMVFAGRPQTIKRIGELPRRGRVLGLIVGGQALVVVAIVLTNLAMTTGPVAPVTAIMAARPAMVFFYTLVLSRFLPTILAEKQDKATILIKSLAIALTVAGVVLLTV